jgi:hypothetical protein
VPHFIDDMSRDMHDVPASSSFSSKKKYASGRSKNAKSSSSAYITKYASVVRSFTEVT